MGMKSWATRRFTRRTSALALAALAGSTVLLACGEVEVRYVQGPSGPAGPAGPRGEQGGTGASGQAGAAGEAGRAIVVEKPVVVEKVVQVPAKAQERIVIKYLSNLPETHPEGATRNLLLNEYNITNPHNHVVDFADALAGADAAGRVRPAKIKTLAAAGLHPDFYYAGAFTETAEFFIAGMTIDLDAELKIEKDWAAQRADIFPRLLKSSTWAGRLVGMPGYTNTRAIIYNKGLLQQQGLGPPQWGWTWDHFREMAQQFAREGMIPFSNGWGIPFWLSWLGTMGALPISDDNRKLQLDTPEMLEVMELWLDFLKRKIMFPRPDGKDGLRETYRQAKNDTVFESQGPFRIPTLRKVEAPDFGVLHTPVHPIKKQVYTRNGGHDMVVFKAVPPERRHAAALLAQWFNAPHAQTTMVITAGQVPVSKATMESERLVAHLKTDEQLKGFIDLAPYGWRWPAMPFLAKMWGGLTGDVGAIMRQEIGPKVGLAEAQRKFQVLLDKDVALLDKAG